jgi:hypothetical protein
MTATIDTTLPSFCLMISTTFSVRSGLIPRMASVEYFPNIMKIGMLSLLHGCWLIDVSPAMSDSKRSTTRQGFHDEREWIGFANRFREHFANQDDSVVGA